MNDFEGMVAVVTGASSGIGKAIALALADRKTALCLVARRRQTLRAVADMARNKCDHVVCHPTDLTVDADIARLASDLEEDFGRLDMLIHGAGTISLGPVESSSTDDFDLQYRVNLRAPYLLTQSLLPMIKKHQGQVVFINSTAGVMDGRINGSQYAATKHALKAVADSLREEVNVCGVRVLSVFPGTTATPMQASIHEVDGRTYRPERLLQPQDVASVVVHALGLPRTAEVTDIIIRPMMKPYR